MIRRDFNEAQHFSVIIRPYAGVGAAIGKCCGLDDGVDHVRAMELFDEIQKLGKDDALHVHLLIARTDRRVRFNIPMPDLPTEVWRVRKTPASRIASNCRIFGVIEGEKDRENHINDGGSAERNRLEQFI